MQTAAAALRRLRDFADPESARFAFRYFKTAPGQYGAGDKFLGLNAAELRGVAREFRDVPLREVDTLLGSPWHEARLLAVVIMANGYQRADEATRAAMYKLYLRRSDRINNWDLVDSSAPGVVGAHLMDRSRAPLHKLARSRLLWDRRIAIISTLYFIRRGDVAETIRLAPLLLDDREDLMHKAVGWALREVGKKDDAALRRFLDRYTPRMPRTALRYAIERMTPADRRAYMDIPRKPSKRSR